MKFASKGTNDNKCIGWLKGGGAFCDTPVTATFMRKVLSLLFNNFIIPSTFTALQELTTTTAAAAAAAAATSTCDPYFFSTRSSYIKGSPCVLKRNKSHR